MTGYTKLFGSIIASTIWRDTKDAKILWITMLAMKNEFDIVEASAPGLADMARLTVEETRAALVILESPDPDSRTPDYDGRRIEKVDGGWLILNGEKYRRMMAPEDIKAKAAERQRMSRARRAGRDVTKPVTNVTPGHTLSRRSLQTEAETETKTETPEDPDFQRFWNAYPNRTGKGRARDIFRRRKLKEKIEIILAAIEKQKGWDQWTRDGGKFIPHAPTWLGQDRWEDEGRQKPVNGARRESVSNLADFS